MTNLINGRTPEVIKSNLSYLVRCENCPQNHEYGCDYDKQTEECRTVIDALALIEHLEAQQPKWISVEERLPYMNQKVLVSDGFIVVEAHYNGRAEWIHNGHCMKTGGVIVTHWMLKPEPPKEDA
jgi:hypothetical protein